MAIFAFLCSEYWFLAHIPIHSLGSYYLRTVARMYVTRMVKKIDQLLLVTMPIKKAWSISGILQRIDKKAHITSYSLGSNYPKTVELSSPKLNAYKS